MTQLPQVPWLVLYQLVLVNYGEFASPDDAETFGAAALGLDRDEYYARLCEMADQIGGCGARDGPRPRPGPPADAGASTGADFPPHVFASPGSPSRAASRLAGRCWGRNT